MADIHLMRAHTNMTVDQALNYVLKENLSDVMIIGYDSNEELVIRSSHMSRSEALWLVEHAKQHVLDFD